MKRSSSRSSGLILATGIRIGARPGFRLGASVRALDARPMKRAIVEGLDEKTFPPIKFWRSESTSVCSSVSHLLSLGGHLGVGFGPLGAQLGANFNLRMTRNRNQHSVLVALIRSAQTQFRDFDRVRMSDAALRILRRSRAEFHAIYGHYFVCAVEKTIQYSCVAHQDLSSEELHANATGTLGMNVVIPGIGAVPKVGPLQLNSDSDFGRHDVSSFSSFGQVGQTDSSMDQVLRRRRAKGGRGRGRGRVDSNGDSCLNLEDIMEAFNSAEDEPQVVAFVILKPFSDLLVYRNAARGDSWKAPSNAILNQLTNYYRFLEIVKSGSRHKSRVRDFRDIEIECDALMGRCQGFLERDEMPTDGQLRSFAKQWIDEVNHLIGFAQLSSLFFLRQTRVRIQQDLYGHLFLPRTPLLWPHGGVYFGPLDVEKNPLENVIADRSARSYWRIEKHTFPEGCPIRDRCWFRIHHMMKKSYLGIVEKPGDPDSNFVDVAALSVGEIDRFLWRIVPDRDDSGSGVCFLQCKHLGLYMCVSTKPTAWIVVKLGHRAECAPLSPDTDKVRFMLEFSSLNEDEE